MLAGARKVLFLIDQEVMVIQTFWRRLNEILFSPATHHTRVETAGTRSDRARLTVAGCDLVTEHKSEINASHVLVRNNIFTRHFKINLVTISGITCKCYVYIAQNKLFFIQRSRSFGSSLFVIPLNPSQATASKPHCTMGVVVLFVVHVLVVLKSVSLTVSALRA